MPKKYSSENNLVPNNFVTRAHERCNEIFTSPLSGGHLAHASTHSKTRVLFCTHTASAVLALHCCHRKHSKTSLQLRFSVIT